MSGEILGNARGFPRAAALAKFGLAPLFQRESRAPQGKHTRVEEKYLRSWTKVGTKRAIHLCFNGPTMEISKIVVRRLADVAVRGSQGGGATAPHGNSVRASESTAGTPSLKFGGAHDFTWKK